MGNIDVNEKCAAKTIYVAFGYPVSAAEKDRAKHIAKLDGISITGLAKPGARLSVGRAVPTNLPMEFDRKQLVVGDRVHMGRHPRGVSGGALLRFDSLHPRYSFNDDKLVGIITEYLPNAKVLVATNVVLFLELIRHHFPTLSAAIPRSESLRVNASRTEPH